MGEKHMADEHWEAAQAALREIVDSPSASLARPGAGGGRPAQGASRGGDLAPAKPVVPSPRHQHVDRKSGLAEIYLHMYVWRYRYSCTDTRYDAAQVLASGAGDPVMMMLQELAAAQRQIARDVARLQAQMLGNQPSQATSNVDIDDL
jgi:hypothetical protein